MASLIVIRHSAGEAVEFLLKKAFGRCRRPMFNPIKKHVFFVLLNVVFNLVWAGFEVGFGLSLKNHADP